MEIDEAEDSDYITNMLVEIGSSLQSAMGSGAEASSIETQLRFLEIISTYAAHGEVEIDLPEELRAFAKQTYKQIKRRVTADGDSTAGAAVKRRFRLLKC